MNRNKIVAGNWKMNLAKNEAMKLAEDLAADSIPEGVKVILAPSFIHLDCVLNKLKDQTSISVAAQNVHTAEKGAYTGEISVDMIKSYGCSYALVGHSERRAYFNESHELLAQKIDALLKHGLGAIFCFGEPLEIRKDGSYKEHVSRQIKESLFHLDAAQLKSIILAYEPIWAIGTGETASPEQAQEMHQHIRALISEKYGTEHGNAIHILYGGSVKPANAAALFSQEDVDGGLVGGASLKAEDFKSIIHYK